MWDQSRTPVFATEVPLFSQTCESSSLFCLTVLNLRGEHGWQGWTCWSNTISLSAWDALYSFIFLQKENSASALSLTASLYEQPLLAELE